VTAGSAAPELDRAVVRAEALSKVYGEGDALVVALDAVDLSLTPGQFTAIMGSSGSGKPTLNAIENITLPMDIAGRQPDQVWLEQVIADLGLADRLKHKPTELSGGQQQRVAIARALASRPVVVFADEPTGNLDSKTGIEVLELLRRSVDDLGQTVVMVTHNAHAASYADRVVFLADSRIVHDVANPTYDGIVDLIRLLEGSGR
jgi:putative ABC transport system ATP-binding protein